MDDKLIEEMLPCPFPHEVKRGVFLEIDTEDFGFARGACSDCGCAGPYVTLESCERVTDAERAEATRLWNTRDSQACASILKNRIEGLEDALKPFAVLEVPSNPEGNAGFYSLRFGDIFKARAALSPVGVTHDL